MLRRLVAILLLSGLALVGCGSDGDSDVSSADGTTDAAKDKATVKEAVAAFEAQARQDGFKADTSSDDDEGDGELEFASAECKRFDEAFGSADEDLPGQTASKDTKSFVRGSLDAEDGSEEDLDGVAATVAKASDLDEVFDLFQDERLIPCLEEGLRAEFASQGGGSEDPEIELTELAIDARPIEGVGDAATDLHISATMGASGIEFPFAMDLAIARKDRRAALVSIVVIGTEASEASPSTYLGLLLGEARSAA